MWVDRSGQETAVSGAPRRAYQYPHLSHDNSRVALTIEDQDRDIWVFDVGVQTITRATFAPALDGMPVWYPDDARLLFVSARDGTPNLYSQRADGTGTVERLTKTTSPQFVPAISPDGASVVAPEQRTGTGNDLVLIRLREPAAAVRRFSSRIRPGRSEV